MYTVHFVEVLEYVIAKEYNLQKLIEICGIEGNLQILKTADILYFTRKHDSLQIFFRLVFTCVQAQA